MVKDICLYLFIGEDALSKDAELDKIKKEFLKPETEAFNYDILYAKELSLPGLQERLLSLPVKAKRRLILIRGAQDLKEDIRDFLAEFVKTSHPQVLLVLDMNSATFAEDLSKHSKVYRFKESIPLNTFALGRHIRSGKADYALRTLNQLLKNGEKPERILGGLRYSFQRGPHTPLEMKRAVRLLLNCDLSIKTGRLKPEFALERLVVKLCGA